MNRRRLGGAAVVGLIIALVPTMPASAANTAVITDPFNQAASQHLTAVEPDTFAFGGTIVTVAQVGRYFNGGASGIGFATSTNGGATWTGGPLPGLTNNTLTGGGTNGGIYDRATDPVVAYDAAHSVWLASSLVLTNTAGGGVFGAGIVVNRSADGLTWGNPVNVALATPGVNDYDKNWVVCDNHATSPHRGTCYHTWDDFADGDRILMSRSTNGGLTWSAPQRTAAGVFGLGGQPVVQPDGDVIVPAANAFETAIIAFRSTDGGVTWGDEVVVSRVRSHTVSANLRTGPLPTAEIDSTGRVFVAWQDCRFRKGCRANDIVWSSSTDGVTWTPVVRVPVDSNANVDHFIPGLGVDPATGGASAILGLTYYFYADASCQTKRNSPPCELRVGYAQSNDAGATWSNPQQLAGPFLVSLTPDTSQGRMVGDYISTSWSGGRAFGAFAVASAPSGGAAFNQAIFVPTGGVTAAAFPNATRTGEQSNASDNANPRAVIRPAR